MMDKTKFLDFKRDTGGDFSITDKFFIGIKTNPVILKITFVATVVKWDIGWI